MSEQATDVSHLLQPLDWTMDRDGAATAYTPFGFYHVRKQQHAGWQWGYCFDDYYDEGDFDCESIAGGQAAAWAHWVARVSPIIALPAPPAAAQGDEG